MSRHKPLLVMLSIALAVLVPLLTAVKAQKDRTSYPVVKVEIEPYDPRDLLRGHYMTFGIKWNWKKDQEKPSYSSNKTCLCVGVGDTDPEVSAVNCPAKGEDLPACAHILKGRSLGDNRFDIGINRYYVDENVALPLEDLFRDKKEKFHVGLSISPSGKPILEKLYVSGKPLNEYVDEQGGKLERIPPSTQP